MKSRYLLAALATIAAAACSDPVATTGGSPVTGNLRFVSGIHGNVNLMVDGAVVLSSVPLGGLMGATVTSGAHTLTVQKVGGASGTPSTVTFGSSGNAVVVAYDNAGVPTTNVMLDTNAVVPAGATKLRVAHFAAGAPAIDVWRTQPDWGTPIRLVFPFNLNYVSNYVQSTPGDWRVMLSHTIANVTDPMPDTLANTGLIPIASGASRTVIAVDGATAGTVQLVVVDP